MMLIPWVEYSGFELVVLMTLSGGKNLFVCCLYVCLQNKCVLLGILIELVPHLWCLLRMYRHVHGYSLRSYPLLMMLVH